MIRLAERYGPVLTGRGLAERLREEVEELIRGGQSVVIDLEGVEAVSPSFADELFGKLVTSVPDGLLRFEHVSPHLQDVARMARVGRSGER